METEAEDTHFHLFTFPEFTHLRAVGKHGRGTGEILSPWNFHLTASALHAYDYPSAIVHYPLQGDEATYDFSLQTPAAHSYYDFTLITDTTFALYLSTTGKRAVHLLDKKGEIIDSLLERPDIKDWPYQLASEVWNSYLAYNPSKNVLVTATLGGEVIDIIHLDTREHLVAVGPDGKPRHGKVGLHYYPNLVEGFRGHLFLGDKYIYALFSGISMEDVIKKNASPRLYALHVYDYEGHPARKYTFKESIISFHVDETANKLYATVNDDFESPIFVYDL
jgi:hypothetical protein